MKARLFAGLLLPLPILAISPLWAGTDEDRAVQALERLGRELTRDEKAPGRPVIGVNLAGEPAGSLDDLLRNVLPHLKSLQQLDLGSAELKVEWLRRVASLKTLRQLNLGFTKVTDADLKELAPLKQLQELNLAGLKVGASRKGLAGVVQLRKLYLHETGVTDTGLKDLASLQELQELGLDLTKVTDAGLKELSALRQLRKLRLFECRGVTGAGLKELTPLE